MQIKKHAVVPCEHHKEFKENCQHCLVGTVVRLCELLDARPDVADTDQSASANGLLEVFEGFNVAHITDHSITNVTALPMKPADLEEGIVRYTVEFRRDK
jgi:hypothetical protein